ncbi:MULTISPECIES: TetR/AcrR family transcriptional regulator [unclassified Nocardiopsis]|uniref:TetR/AcrR family transcriptional regulator n=1 Tax=Nocardiopsis TaxID=2013 RepID=UPI00387B9528
MSVAPHAGPSPRTPRDQVRRRLLDAAARVFAEQGYAGSRLDDIARTAGFTKGAVYSNFGGKHDLFAAVLSERSATEADAVAAHARDSAPAAALDGIARDVARRVTQDTERGRLGLEFAAHATRDTPTREAVARMRRTQRATTAEAVTRLVERGLPLATDPATAALIVHALANGLSMEYLADPDGVDADAVEHTLAAALTALTAAAPAVPAPANDIDAEPGDLV